jgi:hypothetical protein
VQSDFASTDAINDLQQLQAGLSDTQNFGQAEQAVHDLIHRVRGVIFLTILERLLVFRKDGGRHAGTWQRTPGCRRQIPAPLRQRRLSVRQAFASLYRYVPATFMHRVVYPDLRVATLMLGRAGPRCAGIPVCDLINPVLSPGGPPACCEVCSLQASSPHALGSRSVILRSPSPAV